VGDTHGIRFPREFGLLLKQLLYFDRYTQLLAPSLSVLNDDRVKIRQTPGLVVLDPDDGNTITI
jgi:aarF domain-containing kinase